jgi:hypothetical protein
VFRYGLYDVRGLDWTDTYDLSPYEHRCAFLARADWPRT